MASNELYELERELHEKGVGCICGVDEAGRGPLAGPVVAAGVILPPGLELEGLDDSKKLTAKKRELLFGQIMQKAEAASVGFADEAEIDEVNILNAAFLAMRRAVFGLRAIPRLALVDGNRDPGLEIPTSLIVGGDGKAACIAAASILAKVTRDRMMVELDARYPGYGFAKHKGYPTKEHYAAIERLGVLPVHRKSFLRTLGRHLSHV